MKTKRILVSWIGHADLSACFDDLGTEADELRQLAKLMRSVGEKPGPLKTAISIGSFDEVHLLSNYAKQIHKPFAKWLGCKLTIHPIELQDPTDYEGIFRGVNETLSKITSASPESKLCILLSPGTPAMAVVWVLLGRSRYPATFYQTGKGQLTEAQIPEALFDEVVPDLLRDRDLALQHLAEQNPSEIQGFEQVIGNSSALRLAVGRAKRAALRDVPVLLTGESGTGKEVFAEAIHRASRRANKPFEAINCASIPKDLLESELFGHVKGAFSGAVSDHKGLFSQLDGGTIFLDEIGECDLLLQAKLLRVLQPPVGFGPCYREFRPVGGNKTLNSDVRIVAATNRNLQSEIQANRFREDLYYRLAVITLHLPPLRERRSDIPLLLNEFLNRINRDFEKQEPGYQHKKISGSAIEFVKKHDWPGNIRQLYNVLLQAAVMTDTELIDKRNLMDALGDGGHSQGGLPRQLMEQPLGEGFNLDTFLNSIQKNYLERAMEEAKGNKSGAARLLGMKHYQTLDAQLARLGINWEETK